MEEEIPHEIRRDAERQLVKRHAFQISKNQPKIVVAKSD